MHHRSPQINGTFGPSGPLRLSRTPCPSGAVLPRWLGVWVLASCAAKSGTTVEDSGVGPVPHRCTAEGDPATIEEAIAHIVNLPPPIDGPCIVASLARPLRVEATSGPFSAQPADGPESPRIFFESGLPPVALGEVPETGMRNSLGGSGPGAGFVEFGEYMGTQHSRKAELPLPVEPAATAADAFAQVADPQYGTGCAICHIDTSEDPRGGQISVSIRPTPGTEVDLATLDQLAEGCGDHAETRCDLLRAVTAGEILPAPSPTSWPTIFEL